MPQYRYSYITGHTALDVSEILLANGRGLVAAPLAAFGAAFTAYKGSLYLVSASWLGGTEDSAASNVARILTINAAGFVALLAGGLPIAAAGARGSLRRLAPPISQH